jgi:glucose/arabinose dehydrogenase
MSIPALSSFSAPDQPPRVSRRRPLVGAALLLFMLSACDGDADDDVQRTQLANRSAEDAGSESGDAAVPPADAGSEVDRDVFRPEERPATAQLIAGLVAPTGFQVSVVGQDLGHARMLATHGDSIYLTRPRTGDVLRLADADANGDAETRETAAQDLPYVHGIAFRGDEVYLATDKQVLRGNVESDGSFGGLSVIIDDLPDGGQHPYRTLGIGPDDLLYISVGSSCDACPEPNPEHATMLRSALDGTNRATFARGLRNTIGFGWHPQTNELWGMDHGSDWRGRNLNPEELNRIAEGNDYGWPYCHGKQQIDAVIDEPPDSTKAAYCASTAPSVLETQAHNAPIGLTFSATTAFPDEYQDDAFVAMRGSWNRFPPTGYKIVRVVFEAGQPVGFEDFVTGFLIDGGNATFGRLAGVAVAADGALLFTDDTNGVIYRVAYGPGTPANEADSGTGAAE